MVEDILDQDGSVQKCEARGRAGRAFDAESGEAAKERREVPSA
jgi:hypothetical protein